MPNFTGDSILECHNWCRINGKGQWKLNCKDNPKAKKAVSPIQLEDDYEAAIARNIAIEIVKNRQKKAKRNEKVRRGDLSRSLTSRNIVMKSDKGRRSHNKVAPVHETTLKKLPPNMINLVEGFLKDLQNESQDTFSKDSAIVVDLSDDTPADISVSLWQIGGHIDLMPTLFHFLSREAIYIVAFDLQQDLHDFALRKEWDVARKEWIESDSDLTNLDMIIAWINMIYQKTRIKSNTDDFDEDNGGYPNNIILVGTNRSGLHVDPRMQESIANLKFEDIRVALRGQPMEHNVCQTYFAIDEANCSKHDEESGSRSCECQLCQLRIKIFHALMRLPSMGIRIPESWATFEKSIQTWIDKGIQHASVEEMFETYEGKGDLASFESMLALYHDLGLIFYWGDLEMTNDVLKSSVILSTQSFATLIAQLTSPFHFTKMVME